MATREELIEKLIPADIRMISSGPTTARSVVASGLPKGKSSGDLTASFLQAVAAKDSSFQQVITRSGKGATLTASRPVMLKTPFHIAPPGNKGVRRALLVGADYAGQNGALKGVHDDVTMMKDYLMSVQGFKEENIALLVDDGKNFLPTHANILWAIQSLVRNSRSGDVVVTYFAGHGGKSDKGECFVPVNYQQAGVLTDQDLYSALVAPMARGVTMTMVMDLVSGGMVLDFPYQFKAGEQQTAMTIPASWSLEHLQSMMEAFQETMKNKRQEIMEKEFQEFADAMLLPGQGCNGDDVVQMFKDGFQAKYKSQGLYVTYNEAAKLLGDWNTKFPKATVTPKGWFMGFHINPTKVRPQFRSYGN